MHVETVIIAHVTLSVWKYLFLYKSKVRVEKCGDVLFLLKGPAGFCIWMPPYSSNASILFVPVVRMVVMSIAFARLFLGGDGVTMMTAEEVEVIMTLREAT